MGQVTAPSQPARLVRVYIERATAERLEAEAAHLTGALGRFVSKARLYSAVADVGLGHRDEVIAALEAT